MPAIAQGASPLVFGDFRRGFVIGDRFGSAINIKILDQSKFQFGLIEVLAFRRTDSRVRRSEALKRFVIDSAS
jgi:HK97 family phage major capsid protein